MIHTSKCVKKFFQPEIEKMGFEYKFHDSQTWRFICMKEDIEQRIDLAIFYGNTALRLYFGTNVHGRDAVDASQIASKEEYPCNITKMLMYDTEEELINWLQMCVQICKKYGEDVFKKISEPISKYWISTEMEIELYEQHNYLIKELKSIYNIDENYSTEQYIYAITTLIKNISEESENIFQQGIIKAAVLLGDLYVSTIGGKWELSDDICVIIGIGNNPNLRAYLINNIFLSWQKKDYYLFLRHYNNLKNSISSVT